MAIVDPMNMPLAGAHLIEASAGTGKTYTITTLYLRLMLELDLDVDNILVVTFTEAAAAELRDRVRRRLQAALVAAQQGTDDPELGPWLGTRRRAGLQQADVCRFQRAIRNFDEAPISTIHGFCQRALQDRAFETNSPFVAEFIRDERPLLEQVVRDFWMRELHRSDPLFVAHLAAHGGSVDRLTELAQRAVMHREAVTVPQQVELERHPDAAEFVRAFREARMLWRSDRDSICELITRHAEHLHTRSYPPQDFPRWFRAMDAFLREKSPGAQLDFYALDRFCESTLLAKTTASARRAGVRIAHPFFAACDELRCSKEPLARNFGLRSLDFRCRLIRHVRRQLARHKLAQGVQSFDDLLYRFEHALRGMSGAKVATVLRQRYRAALIDEFQDTDPIQYRIVNSIFLRGKLPAFLIGDPKQAIYAFRGADVFAYLSAAASIPRSRHHTMDRNWRSDPELLAAIEHLFAVPRPFRLESIAFLPVRAGRKSSAGLFRHGDRLPGFEILFQGVAGLPGITPKPGRAPRIPLAWADSELPHRIASDIAELLAGDTTLDDGRHRRPVRAGDVAVLVRKNAQAAAMQGALRALGIASVVYGDASVFATHEAGELWTVLLAVAEPTRTGRLRAALATDLLGLNAHEIAALTRDDVAWDMWVERFRRWHSLWIERGFIQMVRLLLDESNAAARLLALLDGERRMTNVLHLAELLHTAVRRQHLGPVGLLRWFDSERRSSRISADAHKLRLERDDDAVQLVTIHRAKGLEYPIVYCPYAWSSERLSASDRAFLVFHDPDDDYRLKLDVRDKPSDFRVRDHNIDLASEEMTAEGLRLLYVALTRARHSCRVVWGPFERMEYSALGYLLYAERGESRSGWQPANVSRAMYGADDQTLWAWLQRRRHESWSLRELGSPRSSTHARLDADAPTLRCKVPPSALDRTFRVSSFTNMTAGPHDGFDPDTLDRDAALEHETADIPAPKAGGQRIVLADFPRGAEAGNFVHDVLEHLDFTSEAGRRDLVARKLAAHGFAIDPWQTIVDRAIGQVLATPLSGADGVPPLRLRDIPTDRRLNEAPFVLPAVSDGDTPVSAADVGQLFKGEGPWPSDYHERVKGLAFLPLRGFVKGFIDLIVEHEGRFYVLDYKTNFVGETYDEYGGTALADVMATDHYFIQYHLYALALVRWLRLRLADFAYERHFGGIFYLFVRGMAPQFGARCGVFFHRPSEDAIEAWSSTLAGRPGAWGHHRAPRGATKGER